MIMANKQYPKGKARFAIITSKKLISIAELLARPCYHVHYCHECNIWFENVDDAVEHFESNHRIKYFK